MEALPSRTATAAGLGQPSGPAAELSGKDLPPGDAGSTRDEGNSEPIDPEVVEEEPEGASTYHVAGEVIHQSVSFRQAPYPTPEDLAEYETVHPGFTDRILSLTERESQHRIQQERLQDKATIDLAKRGQIFAFIVVITLVLGAVIAILTDHSIVGLAGLVVAAATLAGTFLAPNFLSKGSDGPQQTVPGGQIEERSAPRNGSEDPDGT